MNAGFVPFINIPYSTKNKKRKLNKQSWHPNTLTFVLFLQWLLRTTRTQSQQSLNEWLFSVPPRVTNHAGCLRRKQSLRPKMKAEKDALPKARSVFRILLLVCLGSINSGMSHFVLWKNGYKFDQSDSNWSHILSNIGLDLNIAPHLAVCLTDFINIKFIVYIIANN